MAMAPHHGTIPPAEISCGILTVSDTRTVETDDSGHLIRELLQRAGHPVGSYAIVPDEPVAVRAAVSTAVELPGLRALIVNGGTGITARDLTVESVAGLWTRQLPGFGEMLRALSYAEIGPAGLLSRATAGVIGGKFVALLPGSPAGCRLALERLILPTLGHVTALLSGER
jgi:molybdopterin adenylyltransferase